jgi:hypothetical protein
VSSLADFYYANSTPPRATLAVGLTRCTGCGTCFEAQRCTARYCSDDCRMRAHSALDKAARLDRRNHHFRLKNRARALGFDGVHGGPTPAGLPRLGDLKLLKAGVTR